MRRTSTLAVKLGALADATAELPNLTEGELRRVAVFARALRRERTSVGPAVSDAVTCAAPCLEALSAVMDRLSDLDALLGVADGIASLGEDRPILFSPESRAHLRELVGRLAGLLDVLIGVDGTELQALALLFRASADGTPPT